MAQIMKKKKLAGALLAGAGVAGVAGAQNVSAATVNGGTVIQATEKGAGHDTVDNISAITQAASEPEVRALNDQIRRIQNASNGAVVVKGIPTVPTAKDVQRMTAQLSKIESQLRTYRELKAQLNAQLESNPMADVTDANNGLVKTIEGDSLDEIAKNFETALSGMKKDIQSNKDSLDKYKDQVATNTEFDQTLNQYNSNIKSASGDLNVYRSGVIGNMDEVNRKSEDSKAAGGIVVDNAETQKVNFVTAKTEKTTNEKVTNEANMKETYDKILKKIADVRKSNEDVVTHAADYKANAFKNIDDINAWLKGQQAKAQKAKEDTAKSGTAINTMEKYKAETLAKLNKAMETLKANGATEKQIKNVQDAIDAVNKSGITEHKMTPVGSKDPIEFGDIGKKATEENGSAGGTIEKTMSSESQKLQDAIDKGVKAAVESNRAAEEKMKPTLDANVKNVDAFLKAIASGSGSAQVDDDFLKKMPIYNNNKQKSSYQPYVKYAIGQTQEVVKSVQDRIAIKDVIVKVPTKENITVAQLSAAMYAENAGTIGDGFGSVMIPDTNLYNVVNQVNTFKGKMIADSRNATYNGKKGATAIYEALLHMPGFANIDYSKLAAVKDLKTQYLDTDAGQTMTFMTNSPTLAIRMKNSFVYSKPDGTTGTADMLVQVDAAAYDGGNIYQEAQKYAATGSGTQVIYVYNFQVNKFTGQLVAGVSYFLTQGAVNGNGHGLPNLNSGGETGMELDFAMYNGSNGKPHAEVGMPISQDYAKRIGLAQTISVHVDPANKEAQKYAKNAPLYVSDIDDGQELIMYTGGATGSKVVTSEESTVGAVKGWKDPYKRKGQVKGFKANTKHKVNGTKNVSTKIDSYSAAIYKLGAGLTKGDSGIAGMSSVTLRSIGTHGYQAIDTALFAPFGIVGGASVKVDPIHADVDTLEVNNPTAKAHTEGKYELTNTTGLMHRTGLPKEELNDASYEIQLAPLKNLTDTDALVSSNTSFVVTKQGMNTNKTASGNSFVVTGGKKTATASGNSFTVTGGTQNRATASGNSFTVRTQNSKTNTGSGNSLVVQQQSTKDNGNTIAQTTNPSGVLNNDSASSLNSAAKSGNNVALNVLKNQPILIERPDGTHSAYISVYADEAVSVLADKALANWRDALAKQGIQLNYTLTDDVKSLKKGVTLAILESDFTSERLDSGNDVNRPDGIIASLGGLTTNVQSAVLTPDGENDRYNTSGTIKAGDALKNSATVIQLNMEGLNDVSASAKNQLMGGNIAQNVLKHEIGHVFGLAHDNADSLMSQSAADTVFTGIISNSDAYTAAKNLINHQTMATLAKPVHA